MCPEGVSYSVKRNRIFPADFSGEIYQQIDQRDSAQTRIFTSFLSSIHIQLNSGFFSRFRNSLAQHRSIPRWIYGLTIQSFIRFSYHLFFSFVSCWFLLCMLRSLRAGLPTCWKMWTIFFDYWYRCSCDSIHFFAALKNINIFLFRIGIKAN